MLVNREGKVFVAQRIDNTLEAWQMPQGGLDEGEDEQAGALRELEEELGIEAEEVSLSPAAFASAELGERHLLLLLYLCREWRGKPEALDAAALKWLRPKEMVADEMPPADRPLIALLEKLI